MKSIAVHYDPERDQIQVPEKSEEEEWTQVCERYDHDVQRVKDVHDENDYSGLYVCYDDQNQPVYYLVAETDELYRLKRKVFLGKLGHKPG